VLSFRHDKDYTIALAWHDPAAPDDYRAYLEGVMPAVEAVGGRLFHTLLNPRYVEEASDASGPSEITIMEWDSAFDLAAFQSSDTFLEHYSKLHSGTTRFELYRVAPIFEG
jgi:hypothetical protein